MNDNPSNAIATRTRRFFANLAEVRQSLALMEDLSEIKDVRDKAEAIRQYAKSAGHGLDLQNDAAEIRLRAERRAGAILATMRLRGGDRRSTNQDRRGGTTLKEIGITHNQSTRWQVLAKLGEEDFESYLVSRRESGLEVTTAGVLRIAKATAPPRIQEADERGRYSILSELEQHRDLLQSILKPEIPADGITLTVEQTRNVHRLLKEMRRLLTQLRKQNSEPDQD